MSRRGRAMAAGLVLVLCAVTVWFATGRQTGPGERGGSPGTPRDLAVQATTGGGLSARWLTPASGDPPARYQVQVVPAHGGPPVRTTTAFTTSVVVVGLTVGQPYRIEVAPADRLGAVATSGPVTVEQARPPDPPLSLVLHQLPGTNGLRVTWNPSPSGVAATGALVRLSAGADVVGQLACQAGCTTAVFRHLAYRAGYTVSVTPTNQAGAGRAAVSIPLVLANPCPGQAACIAIDATTTEGAATMAGSGFLNSLYPVGNMIKVARSLHPKMWRGSPNFTRATGALDWSSWDAAVATGAKTTLLLSNLWNAETTDGTGARTPWSDWTAYATWVKQAVRMIESSGHHVDYWEIQNEPGDPTYYRPAGWATATVAQFLQQFLLGYGSVKAVDSDAAIIGPSLANFSDYPGQYSAEEPDLVTFLDFAAGHGLRLAAVTWHEIDDTLGPVPADAGNVPQIVEEHVAEARALIAARPALGKPQIWINEYGRPSNYAIPGWTLGDLAALEAAKVDGAGRSCWPEQVPGSPVLNDCSAPTLDGVLATDGSTPKADYWVYATYAHMTGDLVNASTSDATLPVLATRSGGHGPVTAMVGRDVGCLPGANASCTGVDAVSVPPQAVSVGVRVPWTASHAQVTIDLVPPVWTPVRAPQPVFHGPVSMVGNSLVLSLPAVADGQDYLITINRS